MVLFSEFKHLEFIWILKTNIIHVFNKNVVI
uniref:Uncharacterized protein n=1 Tax=Anguilla anguilla TaxID=7936 RepID=A0A0E9RB77_ANGAN